MTKTDEYYGDKELLKLYIADYIALKVKIDVVLDKYGIDTDMDLIELSGVLSDTNRTMALMLCKDRQKEK